MRVSQFFLKIGTVFIVACGSINAGHLVVDTTVEGMKIELHVVPAEPFFTQDEVTAGKISAGMLIVGGEKPLALDAKSHKNRHLVIHVYDVRTGEAVSTAQVKMSYQPKDSTGKALGNPKKVPVVTMQAIGKGKQSTHFGNNVVMEDGSYAVLLEVNKRKLGFEIKLTDAPSLGTAPCGHKH